MNVYWPSISLPSTYIESTVYALRPANIDNLKPVVALLPATYDVAVGLTSLVNDHYDAMYRYKCEDT